MYYVFKRDTGHVSFVNAINARDRQHAEERLAAGRGTFEILAEVDTWDEANKLIVTEKFKTSVAVKPVPPQSKQGLFNQIAKLLWPNLTGNIWPGEVTMKLMEIGKEWGGQIERAGDLAARAEELPEGEKANTLLREVLRIATAVL